MSNEEQVPSDTEDVKSGDDSKDKDAETETETLESYLAQNGLYNPDLLQILKDENISTVSDLKNHFRNPGDITAMCNALRKRTETIVRNFSKNISSMTGINNEYQEPVFPIPMKSPRALPNTNANSNSNKNDNNNSNSSNTNTANKNKNNQGGEKSVRPKHTPHAKTKGVTKTTNKNKNKNKNNNKNKDKNNNKSNKNGKNLNRPNKPKQRTKSKGTTVTSPKRKGTNTNTKTTINTNTNTISTGGNTQAQDIINAAAARKGSSVVGTYKKQTSVSKVQEESKVTVENVEQSVKKGADLKNWLQKNSIFHKELFSYLVAHEYYSPDDLVDLSQKKFDKIVRQVRVGAFEEVDEPAKRKRIDKLLVKFEKEWRKHSGVNKTTQPAPKDLPASFWG